MGPKTPPVPKPKKRAADEGRRRGSSHMGDEYNKWKKQDLVEALKELNKEIADAKCDISKVHLFIPATVNETVTETAQFRIQLCQN